MFFVVVFFFYIFVKLPQLAFECHCSSVGVIWNMFSVLFVSSCSALELVLRVCGWCWSAVGVIDLRKFWGVCGATKCISLCELPESIILHTFGV